MSTLMSYAQNEWIVYAGERFCRYPGCVHDTSFQNTNALKHHINQKHITGEVMVRSSGGRPSQAVLREAIDDFYEPMHIRFEQQHAGDVEHRPSLPLKRDGRVNMTQMREKLRDMGYTGSCDSCKAEGATRTCCHESRRSACDYFDYFTDEDDEES